MKAVQLVKYDSPDAISYTDVEEPKITQSQIAVNVYAAGINPIDYKIRGGFRNLPLPITLGYDFSGIVSQVGADVKDFVPGDEVYGAASVLIHGSGTFAEKCVVDPSTVAKKPKNTDFIESSALPLAGITALQALTEHLRLGKGYKILIHGGAGGVGHFAIQIAKSAGAIVATTVSGKDFDFVKDLGASVVIDYRNERFEEKINRYDAVLDTIGGDVYKRSFKVLRKGGAVISLVAKPDEDLMKQSDIRSVLQFTSVTKDKLEVFSDLVDHNKIRVHIDKVFPLNQVTEALNYQHKNSPEGKVIIRVK